MNPNLIKFALEALLELIQPRVPKWLYALLKSFIEKIDTLNVAVPVGDAPDVIKTWLITFLKSQVSVLVPLPFVALLINRVLDSFTGPLLDLLWDTIVAEMTGSPVPVSATAGTPTAIDVDDLVDAAC